MEVEITLACYNTATITAVKSFIVQAPGKPILGEVSKVLGVIDTSEQ